MFPSRIALLIFYGCLLVGPFSNDIDHPILVNKPIVFIHANVITMETSAVLYDHSIFIQEGFIEKIEPSRYVPSRDSFLVIDANSMFLMPGIADMHTHVRHEDDLLPYIANGVTTILNMGSPSHILTLKKNVGLQRILSPTIYTSGFVDGTGQHGFIATDAQKAIALVDTIQSQGWDFIKVYNSIPAIAYKALMKRAKEKKIPVIGHGVRSMGMEGILAAGQVMIAHAEEYLYTYLDHDFSDSMLDQAVLLTKNAHAYVTPNLVTYHNISIQWGDSSRLTMLMNKPEMKYVDPGWKNVDWLRFDFTKRAGNINHQYKCLMRLTKKMHEAGVPLLVGTDTPFMIGEVNGFSIHDDLRILVECGLSPYEAIGCSTKNAGAFIHEYVANSQPFGLLKKGYKADLILLKHNPLLDINHLKLRAGVMVNGKWFSEEWIQARMNHLADKFQHDHSLFN